MSNSPHEENKKTPESEPQETGEETLDDETSLSREDLKIRPRDENPRKAEDEGDSDDGED